MENACSGVHSAVIEGIKPNECQVGKTSLCSGLHLQVYRPFFVGLDIAKIAGLVEVESLRASKTYESRHQKLSN